MVESPNTNKSVAIEMRCNRFRRVTVLSLCALLLGGCATARTMVAYQPGYPWFMSGTRLDIAAIRGDQAAVDRSHAKPPAFPRVDLPFSFGADLFSWILLGSVAMSGGR